VVVCIASLAFSPGPVGADRHPRGLPGARAGARRGGPPPPSTGCLAAWLVAQFFLSLVSGISRPGAFLVSPGSAP
jgi:hypothetical protein